MRALSKANLPGIFSYEENAETNATSAPSAFLFKSHLGLSFLSFSCEPSPFQFSKREYLICLGINLTPDQDNPFASPAKTISVAQAVTPPPSLDGNQPIHFSGRIEDPDLTILGIRATGIAKHLGIAGIGLIGVAPMLLVFAKPIFPSIGFRYEDVAATSVVLGYVALITTALFLSLIHI